MFTIKFGEKSELRAEIAELRAEIAELQALNAEWEAYADYWKTRAHDAEFQLAPKVNVKFDSNLVPSAPANFKRTIKSNGKDKIVTDSAYVMPGMGSNGLTRPVMCELGLVYYLKPNQSIAYGYDEYGNRESYVVTTEESIVETQENKPADQKESKQKATNNSSNKTKQHNDTGNFKPASQPTLSDSEIISKVVSKTGKGKLSTEENRKAGKLIGQWRKRGTEFDTMISTLVSMRNRGLLSK